MEYRFWSLYLFILISVLQSFIFFSVFCSGIMNEGQRWCCSWADNQGVPAFCTIYHFLKIFLTLSFHPSSTAYPKSRRRVPQCLGPPGGPGSPSGGHTHTASLEVGIQEASKRDTWASSADHSESHPSTSRARPPVPLLDRKNHHTSVPIQARYPAQSHVSHNSSCTSGDLRYSGQVSSTPGVVAPKSLLTNWMASAEVMDKSSPESPAPPCKLLKFCF